MNTNIAYLVIASLLVMVFLVTRNIKTVDSEYFVLDKTEKTFGPVSYTHLTLPTKPSV